MNLKSTKGTRDWVFLYQHLCTAALANSEQYEIVAEEIQLNDSDGKTIGAIDLILKK